MALPTPEEWVACGGRVEKVKKIGAKRQFFSIS